MPSNVVHQQRNKREPPMFVPPARHFPISNLQSATHPRQQASQCQPKSFKNDRKKIPPSLRYILQRAAPRPILPQPLPLDGGGPSRASTPPLAPPFRTQPPSLLCANPHLRSKQSTAISPKSPPPKTQHGTKKCTNPERQNAWPVPLPPGTEPDVVTTPKLHPRRVSLT